jgi:NAD(P)-dependent dehydrogenase (short-subunit alcohol dehydrogenase family)
MTTSPPREGSNRHATKFSRTVKGNWVVEEQATLMSCPKTYRGKRIFLSGCSSGIGKAVAHLLIDQGAEVHGFDWKEPGLDLCSFTPVDLSDPVRIEAATAPIEGRIDALFNCAGLSYEYGAIDTMKVNFLGTRSLTEALLPRMSDGGAIVSVASSSARGWLRRLPSLIELVESHSFDEGLGWYERHLADFPEGYAFSKEALVVWTMVQSARLIRRGIRINCTMPGPTQTPMVTRFEESNSAALIDACTTPIDRKAGPEEQALPLLFLNSEDASYVNGVALAIDGGFGSAMATGQIDTDAFVAAQTALARPAGLAEMPR